MLAIDPRYLASERHSRRRRDLLWQLSGIESAVDYHPGRGNRRVFVAGASGIARRGNRRNRAKSFDSD